MPILVAGQVSGLDAFKIGAMAGRQLPFLSVLVPFWIVLVMDGWKGIKETWPAVLVAGVSFAISQYLTSNFIGPELPDVTSALISLVCLTGFLKFWKPVNIFRFKAEGTEEKHSHDYTNGQVIRAWSPFLFLTAMVIIWSLPSFKALFAKGGSLEFSNINWAVPYLHNLVAKAPPMVAAAKAIPAVYTSNLLSATGTAILIAAIISIGFLGLKAADGVKVFGDTLNDLKKPIYTIGSVLALAFVANASGLSTTLALLLAGAGRYLPLLLADPRLAGRVPDRIGHLVQRLVRRVAGDHRQPDRRQGYPAGGRQQHRRRQRQDDLAAVHRGGLRRRGSGGIGGAPVPLHPQAQRPHGADHRRDDNRPGLLAALDHSVIVRTPARSA